MSITDMHPCALCATLQKTCCQRAEILVTVGDFRRIREATGRDDFTERRVVTDPSYLDQPDDPNWVPYTVVPEDGTRHVLRRKGNGDCGFLTETGCSLPMETRPLVCRLYPFAYNEQGITGADGHYCPEAVTPPGRNILHVLDMRIVDGMRWHGMLYHELRTKEVFDESGTDLRPAC